MRMEDGLKDMLKPKKPAMYKPKPGPERCRNCGSTNLIVVRDCSWPSVECANCGAYVRDFGD